jgi:hypothetical protein
VDLIAFGNEQVSQIGTILTGDPCDERFLHDFDGADTVRAAS